MSKEKDISTILLMCIFVVLIFVLFNYLYKKIKIENFFNRNTMIKLYKSDEIKDPDEEDDDDLNINDPDSGSGHDLD